MVGGAFPIRGPLAASEWTSSTGDSLALRDSPDARGGDHSSFHPSWIPARPPAWMTRLATVLAVAAFLFIVSHCPLPSVPAAGSRLMERRLASGEEGHDRQQNTTPSDWLACYEVLHSSDEEEEGMPVEQSQTSEAVHEEGTVTKNSPPERENSEADVERSPSAKTARSAAGEEAPESTPAASDPHSASPTSGKGSSRSSLEASEGTSNISEDLLNFYFEGAMEAVAQGEQPFESWFLDPTEELPLSPTGEAVVEKEEDTRKATSPIEGPSVPLRGPQRKRKKKTPVTGTAISGTLTKRRREVLDYERHPFYRMPEVPESVAQAALEMVPDVTGLPRSDGKILAQELNTARIILAKPAVTASDVQALLNCATRLIDFASAHMSKPLRGRKCSDFLKGLSMRFFVADTLYCVCDVVGPAIKKGLWWDKLMSQMLAPSPMWSPKYMGSGLVASRRQLAERLISAFDLYSAGRRPAAREVVQMKQEIFCGDYVIPEFKDFWWNPWREADKEFQESS
ncbi:hypothetical protein Efla_001988 [Eimeria flavescens]